MRFRKLVIEGFKSFRQRQEFIFPESHCGLYSLFGKNKRQPTLGSNGAGKTSLWDAVLWILFGRTARGLKAGDVANWDTDTCLGILEFDLGNESYTITRTWHPNALELMSHDDNEVRDVTQEELQDLIGFDYASFMSVVLMGQFNKFFFDLSATEKLKVFSDALDLHVWVDASKRARKLADDADKLVHQYEVELASLESKYQQQCSSLKELRETAEGWAEERSSEVRQLRKDVASYKHLLNEWKDARNQAKRDLSRSTRLYEEAEQQVRESKAELNEVQRRADKALYDAASTKKGTHELKAAMTEARQHCPTCGQVIGYQVASKLKKSLKAKFKDKWDLYCRQKEKARQRRRALSRAQAAHDKLDRAMHRARTEMEGCKQAAAKAAQGLLAAERALEVAQQGLKRAEKQESPFTARIREAKIGKKQTLENLELCADNLAAQHHRSSAMLFWSGAFKELRLWVIQEALQELQLRTNASLRRLGLEGWQVTFDIERPKKTKGVTKGFSVFITSPARPNKPCPWESWSGGETQRLRIAGAIGLSSLIAGRRGLQTNLEIWDEPTAHLSEEGIEDLLNFFTDRSNDEGKQVWLVDHRSIEFGDFTETYMIVKDKKGSRIVRKAA